MTPRSFTMCLPLIFFLLTFFLHKNGDRQETLTKSPLSFETQVKLSSNLAFLQHKNIISLKKKKIRIVCVCSVTVFKCVSFHYLEHVRAPPPCLLHRSTPVYPRQADLRSSGPQSHHGGSHYSRAGCLSRSKEPLHSSCHPAPLRPVPTSGLDSSIHL